jgi:hypothetical protein
MPNDRYIDAEHLGIDRLLQSLENDIQVMWNNTEVRQQRPIFQCLEA